MSPPPGSVKRLFDPTRGFIRPLDEDGIVNRRSLLQNVAGASAAFVVTGGAAVGAHELLSPDCPDPNMENPVPYEVHDVSVRVASVPGEESPGGFLVTSRDRIDRLDERAISSEGREILHGLDFDEQYAVGVTVMADAGPFRVLGVDRASESTVYVHTCHGTNRTDELAITSWLLVIDRGESAPGSVVVTTAPRE